MRFGIARNGTAGYPLTARAIAQLCDKRLGTSKEHALRHTFARALEDAGAKVSEIQAQLGHESLDTTGRYLARLHQGELRHHARLAALYGLEMPTTSTPASQASPALLLSLSARLSRRWWLGVSLFISCLLVIAFGERSRSAASDLRPLLVNCLGRRLPNCGVRVPELTDATQWVMLLGIPVVIATSLGLLAALATLSAERRVAVERAPTLLLATLVAGAGAYLTADGVAGCLTYAYLADITQAGDGLGQIPLIQAIFITAVGLVVLAVGLTLMVVGTPPRRRIA